jgi:hypothetical protein
VASLGEYLHNSKAMELFFLKGRLGVTAGWRKRLMICVYNYLDNVCGKIEHN